MKRIAGVLVFVVSAAAFAGCASHGSDVDSESHFQCGEDGDCKNADGRTICGVSGWCEFPGSRLTVLNEQPGPVADCTTQWPPTTLRFDTVENGGYSIAWGDAFSSGPRLNRNGTVVVNALGSTGYLIRWAGDTVSRFKQPDAGVMIPHAVSCDGMSISGWTESSDPYRWTADNGFSQLPGATGAPSDAIYRALAVSSDGTTTWGTVESLTLGVGVAIRWNGDLAETLFTLPRGGYASPGWSGDASVFTGYTTNDLFVQNAGAPPTYLETPPELRTRSLTAVSFDASVIAGLDWQILGGGQAAMHGYLWSSHNHLEYLPENASVSAVTPGGVAVGQIVGSDSPPEADFVWDRKHGARHLREILATHGLQLPADTIIGSCSDISADGRVITGSSSDSKGGYIFRAIVPAGAFD